MAVSPIKTVFYKELRDLFRDKRTLMVTVILPLLLYPLIFIGFTQLSLLQAGKLKEQVGRVALLTPAAKPGDLLAADSSKLLEFTDSTGWEEKLRAGELDAALALDSTFSADVAAGRRANMKVYYLSSRDFSEQVRGRIERGVDEFESRIVAQRIAQLGVDTSYIRPVAIEALDTATETEQTGSVLGRFLGYFLILMTLTGAFYAAIDLTAGEKERGTLETLLVSPASRRELVYGKFLAVVVAALISALLNLLSLGLTMVYAVQMFDKGGEISSFAVAPSSLVLVLFIMLPLAVLFAGVTMAVAVTARSYKEGQGLLTPLMVVSILPSMVSMIPGIELTPFLAVIPIANVSLLTRTLMSGHTPWLEFAITLLSTAGLAALSLHWVIVQFNRESVLFRHAEEMKWTPFAKRKLEPGSVPNSGSAALLGAVSLILVAAVGTLASSQGMFRGLFMIQGAIAALAVLWVKQGGYDPIPTFGWRLPRPRMWIGAALAILGGWVLTVELATLQHAYFPFPEEMLEDFSDLFAGLTDLPMWQAIFIIAVLPAIVEEHLCRGVMLRGMLQGMGRWPAILIVAGIFALLHMNPYRLLPTFVLGVLLGYLAVSSGSIFPAMLGHFVNNALSYLVFRFGDAIEALGWAASEDSAWVPWPWMAVGITLLAIGIRLVARAEPPTLPAHSG
ncbi:MAG: CPBP family intramembrane metalloprotease [bacterium]|nr:CPBP family intramembrane metalloprotease [bacterium]